MFEFCFDLEQEKCVQDFFQTLPVNSHVIQFLRRKNSITETKIIPSESASVKLFSVRNSSCGFVTGKVSD